MSKFKVGDTVRVTLNGIWFDLTGEVFSVGRGEFEYGVTLVGDGGSVNFREYELTLADPDAHTVLDEMDAESAADTRGMVDVKSADPVNHPQHYGGDTTYEVIKVAEALGLDKDAYLFNVLKYVARAGKKGDVLEDLEKGDFYLSRRIATIKATQ